MKEKRKTLRSELWNKQDVFISMKDNVPIHTNQDIPCRLENLSSQGMFILTEKKIELGKEVRFHSDFKSYSSNGPTFKGEGVITRSDKNGLAVKFTDIDISDLQQCIFWMIDNE
jgi:hypothetical protein